MFALAFVLSALALLSFSYPHSRAASCSSYHDSTTATWVSKTDLCYMYSDYQQVGSSGNFFLEFNNISYQSGGQAPCGQDQINFTSNLSQKTAQYSTDTADGIGPNGSYTCGSTTRYVNINVAGSPPTNPNQQATWASYNQISYAGNTYTEYPYPYDQVGSNSESLLTIFFHGSVTYFNPNKICSSDTSALAFPELTSNFTQAQLLFPQNTIPSGFTCQWFQSSSPTTVQMTGTRPKGPGASWSDHNDLTYQGYMPSGYTSDYQYNGNKYTDSNGAPYYEFDQASSSEGFSDCVNGYKSAEIMLNSLSANYGIFIETNNCNIQSDLSSGTVIDITNTQPTAAGQPCGTTGQVTNGSGQCVTVGSACSIPNNGGSGTIQSDGSCQASAEPCPITNQWLGWILCPMINLAQDAINTASAALQNLLYTPGSQIFSSNFQGTFDVFRDFGEALLVIAGLVMVVSQAAGLEIFAAYTIRKALPRLILAAIGIALAGPILQFIVTFFDDIGSWIQQIIIGTVNIPAANVIAPISGYSVQGTTLGILGTFAGLLASAGIVISFVFTILIAILIALVVLSIRQLVILICIIIAPLAIAAAVLPGTQKMWNFWRDTLLKALMMFPIIMAFFGAGVAMSKIAYIASDPTSANPDLGWQLLGVGVYVAPLFLLPFAFSMSGGLMGSINSAVSSKGQGAFKLLSSYRQNKAGERLNAAKTGNFWRNYGWNRGIAKGGSGLMQRAAIFTQEPLSAGKRKALRSATTVDLAGEAIEKNSAFRAIKDNDTLLWAALKSGGSQTAALNYLKAQRDAGKYSGSDKDIDRDVGQIMLARQTMGERNFVAAAAIAQAATGTGYADAGEMLQTIKQASGGDRQLAGRMLGSMRSAAVQSGRHDLGGAGYGSYMTQLNNAFDNKEVDTRGLNLAALASTDSVTLGRGRKVSVEKITDAVQSRMTELRKLQGERQLLPEEQKEFGQLAANLENLRDTTLMYAAPERVEVVSNAYSGTSEARREIQAANQAVPQRPSINPVTNQPNPLPGPVEGYREQRSSRYQNPNDPNAPPE